MFLILYDGATNRVAAEVVQDKQEPTIMSLMTGYVEKYHITPNLVVADQAFMTPHMEAYYNRQNIERALNL